MLGGEEARLQRRELFEYRACVAGVGEIIHGCAELLASRQDFRIRHRLVIHASLREKVAAEQRFTGRLEQHAAIPAVGDVGRGEPFEFSRAGLNLLAVGKASMSSVEQVPGCGHCADVARQDLRLGRELQELRGCARFVSFMVGIGDVAECFRVEHRRDGGAD